MSQGAMAEEKVPTLVQDLSRAALPVLSAERLSAVCWYNNCKKKLCPLLVQQLCPLLVQQLCPLYGQLQ